MRQTRGILHLMNPLEPRPVRQIQKNTCETALICIENERCFSQAQDALWKLRRNSEWICVTGRGEAAFIALALAAQERRCTKQDFKEHGYDIKSVAMELMQRLATCMPPSSTMICQCGASSEARAA